MRYTLLIIVIITVVSACDRTPGPDSITSHRAASLSDCGACHLSDSGIAPNPLITNGSGTAGKHIAHVTSSGLGCERCHYGFESNPAHTTGAGPVVVFDPLNSTATPSATWTYTAASGTIPQSGICSNVVCHAGTASLDWYGTNTWNLPAACSSCHSTPVGVRRRVLGPAGDFGSNTVILSRHVISAGDPTPAQCRICHEMTHHMAGNVRLINADSAATVTYVQNNAASLEPFCLSCHDQNGANGNLSPFADGAILGTMPYLASGTVASSWNGYSAHRSRGLTCAGTGTPNTGCHGTISAGSGTVNMHGSTLVGMLSNTMNFRITLVDQATYIADPLASYNESNYKLCFDCHAYSPNVTKEAILGYARSGSFNLPTIAPTPYDIPSIRSSFRDRYISNPANYPVSWGGANQTYNDIMMIFGQPNLALHNYHLIGFMASFPSPTAQNLLAWNYRGDPFTPVRIQCTACHSIHGTSVATIRSTYPELGLQTVTGPGGDVAVSIIASVLNSTIMNVSPINCTNTCHAIQGQTFYWHSPSGEF